MKRRVGDNSVSDVFVASHLFCVISERESALRGKLNSDLEMSIQVLYMPGYKKRSRSSPSLCRVVDKCDFNRRTLMTPQFCPGQQCSSAPWVSYSLRKRDGEGPGCVLVLACCGLVSAGQHRDGTQPT